MTDEPAHPKPAATLRPVPGPPPDPEVLGPLAGWVGTWRGPGRGDFPTIEPFEFIEEVVFGATGKPVLSYAQRTRARDGRPLHAESGWIRLVGSSPDDVDGPRDTGNPRSSVVAVEWVVAQPTGLVEAGVGTLGDDLLDVTAEPLGTPTAVVVTDVRRRYRRSGDELAYDLWMATEAVPSRTHHLAATLRRAVE